ncbi:organelle RRM domain-containing protein 1, chloroplastic isoform X3 [Malania oleifera]|uniref:organelle RRM domain-containing protein 1, chloroplastic isoform X3 n=1 Tax=Malania oleifera TaxID=397392 RepID=UPI0025ADEF58|nr:organelle RRM domain-containing protein 1, chloroplastic isoform X3 [Malania oleifera]
MALLWRCLPPLPPLQSHTLSFRKLSVSEPLLSRRSPLKLSPASKFSSFSPWYSSPASFHCCLSSSSSIECDKTRIFIKGLPLTTSERILTKAFSRFGEVSKVRIITDKKYRQSLGFAYLWFTTEESAQLAIEEMNGKFFDGRFIYVTIARPGPPKNQVIQLGERIRLADKEGDYTTLFVG